MMGAMPRGVCVWFTGLSGSGKSTTAGALVKLIRQRGRDVTVLDGDAVRTHLSSELGFSREDRDTNVRRIGYVAAEVVRHGGIAVVSAVSPYRATRDEVRTMVGDGRFVEVFVDTPLEVCEQRDVKGLYARARAGKLALMTGIDDPYEPPLHPEITLHTTNASATANARHVLDYLEARGSVPSRPPAALAAEPSGERPEPARGELPEPARGELPAR
jgi:sulfate adenylyltransferase